MEIDIPGKFSIYNSLTAIAICRHFGVSEENIIKALKVARVKGRIEMVKVSDEFTLMIDYAHNAMALESLLTTLRDMAPQTGVSVRLRGQPFQAAPLRDGGGVRTSGGSDDHYFG